MKVVIIDDEPLISDKLKRIVETGLRGMHMVCAFTDAQNKNIRKCIRFSRIILLKIRS